MVQFCPGWLFAAVHNLLVQMKPFYKSGFCICTEQALSVELLSRSRMRSWSPSESPGRSTWKWGLKPDDAQNSLFTTRGHCDIFNFGPICVGVGNSNVQIRGWGEWVVWLVIGCVGPSRLVLKTWVVSKIQGCTNHVGLHKYICAYIKSWETANNAKNPRKLGEILGDEQHHRFLPKPRKITRPSPWGAKPWWWNEPSFDDFFPLFKWMQLG